jgi:hypothetical protein
MIHAATERRIHKVLFTRNTQYHMRGSHCVAVRKGAESLTVNHGAVGKELEGSFGYSTTEGFRLGSPGKPISGQRLLFTGDILTSALVKVERSSREDFLGYSAAC